MALLGRRAYGWTADGPMVRRMHSARTAWRRGGVWHGAIRSVLGCGASLGKACGLWRRATSVGGALGGARVRTPRARTRGRGVTARRRGAERGRPIFNLLSLSLNTIYSKILNKSEQNFEYENCRSHCPLQLSQRPYGVFLNRFCRSGLPTLNATQFQGTGGTIN
jgi:hypothetical protein